jgi:Holliday junction resolvase RusA-like endonuclease
MSQQFSCTLPIPPFAKGRPRFGKGFTYTPAKTRAQEKALKLLLMRAFAGRQIMTGALAASITFSIKRPRSVSKTRRPWPSVRPDLDNYVKAVMDAANGILWEDDSQVCCLNVEKRYSEIAGVWIAVSEY